jgi:hypothetical protein
MNETLMATGVATTFVAGLVVGVLLSQWRFLVKARRAPLRRSNYPVPWDIHCVLNAMNKIALTAERSRPVEPALVYLISDYLLHSTLIQRDDGWVDRNSLEGWLLAHVRVLADHRSQSTLPAVTVQMSDDIRRIHAQKLIRQLLLLLQKFMTVSRIHIEILDSKVQDRMVKVRVAIEGDRAGLDKLTEEDRGTLSSWQLDGSVFSCEFRAAFEVHSRH